MRHFIIAMCILLSVSALSAQTPTKREGSLLFQAGIGAGFPQYPSAVASVMDYAEKQSGVTRAKIDLDVFLGYGLSENGYVTFGFDGIGDRLSKNSNYMQVNSYLFAIGYRYSPSIEGLYVGLGAGMARMVVDSNGATTTSDPGYGASVCVGYDFNKNRGFGLGLEAKYLYMTIESETVGAFAVTGNLIWK